MNTFIADLHIHSRFSRATSSRLTAPHLAAWSILKGISVLGTGDLTHPVWRAELREALVEDEDTGLYRLRRPVDVAAEIPGYKAPPNAEANGPLFMLESEISSIYKRGGATRKVHNLVYMPDFASAERLCAKLEQIGNLKSDGRPILGLDSERLLELVMEADDRAVLIPAHVWTPWFALFGSKSGFNSIRECFGEHADAIFAMETGLSSDPDMNRLWSELDRIVMVSNSDAHSGENLGREGTVFYGAPSYDGIFAALRRAASRGAAEADRLATAVREGGAMPEGEDCLYAGTLEFFPEEGKYHLDGHRKCNVMFDPVQTRKAGDLCPVCGKPLTVGVLNRVMALADRTRPEPEPGTGFTSLIPLSELVGECLGVGSKSARVQARTAELIARLGSEFAILRDVPLDTLRQTWAPLGEAIGRMRGGKVIRQGGYDGEYGVVRVFTEAERQGGAVPAGRKRRTGCLPGLAASNQTAGGAEAGPAVRAEAEAGPVWASLLAADRQNVKVRKKQAKQPGFAADTQGASDTPFQWSEAQRAALTAGPGPVLVIAGPGAGKTRTLVGRMAHLLGDGGLAAHDVVAVTFTRRAAAELQSRLAGSVPGCAAAGAAADTLHALALQCLQGEKPAVLSEDAARALFASAAGLTGEDGGRAFDQVALCRETLVTPPPELQDAAFAYAAAKHARRVADYTDLLEMWLAELESGASRPGWKAVLVDEVQDLSPLQIRLLQALLPADGEGFFGIGDPDQSIYGFRGAQPRIEEALRRLWPALKTLSLSESYRSGADILKTASSVLEGRGQCGRLSAVRPLQTTLRLYEAPDARGEAAWIAQTCGELLGPTSHTMQDTCGIELSNGPCSPADIAVLVRVKALARPIAEAMERLGIPCAVPEAEVFWNEPRIALMLDLAATWLGRPASGDAAMPLPDAAAFEQGPRGLLAALQGMPPFDDMLGGMASFHRFERQFAGCGSWNALLDWLAVRQELDAVREAGERVRIMTVHAAKGLEFRAVFLPDMEDGLFPFEGPSLFAGPAEKAAPRTKGGPRKASGGDRAFLPGMNDRGTGQPEMDAEHLAEERRLFYVGVTRASEAVFVSHARSRQLYGHALALRPSRFLDSLPDLFTRIRRVRHVKTDQTQLSLV